MINASGGPMLLLFALACTGDVDQEATFDEALATELDATLNDAFGSTAAPGAAAAVRVPGEPVVYTWTVGHSDHELEAEVVPDDIWALASVTKLYTVTLLFELVDDGVVSLDDPLSDYVSDYPRWNNLTLGQLASHTSGLTDWDEQTGLMLAPGGVDNTAYLASVHEDDLAFEPGTAFGYSNAAYMLLGLVIGEATGDDWRPAMRTRILDPHGLRHTQAPGDGTGPTSNVAGWIVVNGEPVPSPFTDQADLISSAGEMVATPEDVVAFYGHLFDGDILSDESLSMLGAEISQQSGQGIGVEIIETAAGRLFTNFGNFPRGVNVRAGYHEELGVSVAVFANTVASDDVAEADVLHRSAWSALGVEL